MKATEIVIEKLTLFEWDIKSQLDTARTFRWDEKHTIELKKALEIVSNLKNIITKTK